MSGHRVTIKSEDRTIYLTCECGDWWTDLGPYPVDLDRAWCAANVHLADVAEPEPEPEPIMERCPACDGTGWRTVSPVSFVPCEHCGHTGRIAYVP